MPGLPRGNATANRPGGRTRQLAGQLWHGSVPTCRGPCTKMTTMHAARAHTHTLNQPVRPRTTKHNHLHCAGNEASAPHPNAHWQPSRTNTYYACTY
eukprot:9760060-Lingulodinium_polyedra.AAC.1